MPMYRYICTRCGTEKVELHGINDNPEIICDVCGNGMERAIGRVGIVFKGSGFYITDSKKSTSKKSDNSSNK
ncbi:FmdB family zinc ribbon protein [Thermosipho atlanticus]|uniref:Putative regulatory protein, FmdB family n=1 Tax=Thermosipho atlanticus DSM 15807 TaxID=1123380 RepID=A0A1M5RUE1_9BACT|nr:FmdB family zinc ribbon protein [Thermosipho atlanticus]SHH29658.1 putative regulatory protein, FmdB family [Thermosipho atlanticus DSM 15807]